MPEDDGREQDGDPDGDPACVEVLVVVIMICEVTGWRSRLHGIPQRSAEKVSPIFAVYRGLFSRGIVILYGVAIPCVA